MLERIGDVDRFRAVQFMARNAVAEETASIYSSVDESRMASWDIAEDGRCWARSN